MCNQAQNSQPWFAVRWPVICECLTQVASARWAAASRPWAPRRGWWTPSTTCTRTPMSRSPAPCRSVSCSLVVFASWGGGVSFLLCRIGLPSGLIGGLLVLCPPGPQRQQNIRQLMSVGVCRRVPSTKGLVARGGSRARLALSVTPPSLPSLVTSLLIRYPPPSPHHALWACSSCLSFFSPFLCGPVLPPILLWAFCGLSGGHSFAEFSKLSLPLIYSSGLVGTHLPSALSLSASC